MRRSVFVAFAIIGAAALWAMRPPRTALAPAALPAPPLVTLPLRTPIIRSTDPTRGLTDAPLTIVEFGDYACPACANTEGVLADLRQEYGPRLRIVWKDLPLLDRLVGSRRLHIAARCAGPQGKFWEYHDALFAEQPREDAALDTLAARIGLDRDTFRACRASAAASAIVSANAAEAQRLGLTAVPTFFVNGIQLVEYPTVGAIRTLLQQPH